MDVASHREAHHCRFHAAEFVDGDRQGPEDRLGDAVAGALLGASRDIVAADHGGRAAVLVRPVSRC